MQGEEEAAPAAAPKEAAPLDVSEVRMIHHAASKKFLAAAWGVDLEDMRNLTDGSIDGILAFFAPGQLVHASLVGDPSVDAAECTERDIVALEQAIQEKQLMSLDMRHTVFTHSQLERILRAAEATSSVLVQVTVAHLAPRLIVRR